MRKKSLIPTGHRLLTAEEEKMYGYAVKDMLEAKKEIQEQGLSPQRVQELRGIIAKGEHAKEQFYAHNYDLVRKQIRGYNQNVLQSIDDDDLIHYGILGLGKAIEKFEPDMGNKFSTLATWWIRQSIQRNVNSTGRLVRLPENRVAQVTRMNKIIKDNENVLTENDINELIKEELGLDDSTLEVLRNAHSFPRSLDEPLKNNNDEGDTTLAEQLDTGGGISGEDNYMWQESCDKLLSYVNKLDEPEADTIIASFNMEKSGEVLTREMITSKYSWTDRKFSTVKSNALRKLKKNMMANNVTLKDFMVEE